MGNMNITGAWLLVEELEAEGWGFRLLKNYGSSHSGWTANFKKPELLLGTLATADTAPQAIHLAYLKAVK